MMPRIVVGVMAVLAVVLVSVALSGCGLMTPVFAIADIAAKAVQAASEPAQEPEAPTP